ncbi:glycoside hydrolase family 2 TIM barrel-domain containing protein [Paenibacillus herberti]|uniref:golvesin C-terminal-like domain-containing protein n=1 Tax=Paenibacillus herberti TaxID=1619309 RepID=UPI001595E90B|nr:glycoside hydrolase family 2 TIM barrel-domain containing protein [Paenibacillus herberti]
MELVINQDARIQYQHITATPDLNVGTAAIQVKLKAVNSSSATKTISVTSSIYDKKTGSLVWSSVDDPAFTTSASITAKESQTLSLQTTLPASLVKLWNFDTPNLYRMETEIRESGVLKHKLSNAFGIRKIEWNSTQFKINGESVRLVGANRVPDDRVNGNTEPNDLIMRDLDMMKKSGVNMTRIFHGQQDPNLLDYADEIGMLIVEEIPFWGQRAPTYPSGYPLAEQWLRSMVETDYNHPSIVGWSVANEVAGNNTSVDNFVQDMFSFVRQMDNTRFLTYASNQAVYGNDASRFSDIIFMNMYGNNKQVETVARNYPGKPIFVSEYGISQTGEDPDKSFFDPANILNAYKHMPQVIGASVWTFNDYRSHFKNSAASQNRTWGAVNVWRDEKKWFETFRDTNSPVKSMSLVQYSQQFATGSELVTELILSPRAVLDLPSYTMKGYKLKWEIYDRNNEVKDGGITDLPVIEPGDPAWSTYVSWRVPAAGLLKQRFTVISPTQYEIKLKEVYFSVPGAPVIKEVVAASGQVRVVFNKVSGAQSYKVKYGTSSLTSETASTINDFIDITGLMNDTPYQFSVVASNGVGDGVESAIVSGTPQAEYTLLPPTLWKAVGVDGGFYVGYTSAPGTFTVEENNKTTYTIQFGTSSGNYTETRSNITNYGAFNVMGLTNGTTYYFRIKMDKDVSGIYYGSSNWSQEISVTPTADSAPPANPVLYSAVSGNGEVSLHFNYVENTTGYRVQYGISPGSLTSLLDINSADSGQYTVTGLTYGTKYYFAISSLNGTVQSGASNIVSVTPEQRIIPTEPLQVLWKDDFEDRDTQGWTADSGTWSVVTEATYGYKQSSEAASEGVTTVGDIAWTNYEVQADVKLLSRTSTAATGIVGRYQDNNNYYYLRLNAGENRLQLLKKVNGTFTMISNLPQTVSLQTVYNLKLLMMGSTIKGYLNGVEKISVTDTSLTVGKIGIRTYNQAAIVDNVEAKGVPVVVVVDNENPEFTANGDWTVSTYDAGYYGNNYMHDGALGADPSQSAVWTPTITEAGTYKVYMRWTAAANRPTAAPLEIKYGGIIDASKTVNQTKNNGIWVEIGSYYFTSSATDNAVKLIASSYGYTIADAVRFVKQ